MTGREHRQSVTRPAQTTYLVESCVNVNFAGTTTREQVLLEMHVVDGQSQSEIARELSVSQQYVSKAIGRALTKLREANPERPPVIDSHTGPASALVQVLIEGRTAPETGKRSNHAAGWDQWELIALAGRQSPQLGKKEYDARKLTWCGTAAERQEHAAKLRRRHEVVGTGTSSPLVEDTDNTTEAET
jgi:hypothetical protein